MKDRDFLVLLVVVSLAVKIPFVLLFLSGFGIDEYLYLSTAREYAETGVFGINTETHDFGFIAPLLPLVMSFFYSAFGESGPLLVSPIMGSLSAIPFFHIGKSIFGSKGGRLAALLVLFNPAFFLLNTRGLTESIAFLLFSVAVLVMMLALKDKRYWLFVFPSILVTFLARYPYGLILLVFLAAVLVLEKKPRILVNRNLLIGLVIAGLIAAPWISFNVERYGNLVGGPVHQASTDIGFALEKAIWYVPYLFVIVAATAPFMIYAMVKGFRDKKLFYYFVGFDVVFIIQFFVFGQSVEERYMLPILPFATMLSVYGYMRLRKSSVNFANYALIAMLVANVAAAAYITDLFTNLPKYVDTELAVSFASENCGTILSNTFTPIYYATGDSPIPVTTDPEQDLMLIEDGSVDCVVVSEHESPYENFFDNRFGFEENRFGKVSVYVRQ